MAERGDHSEVSLPELILMRQADNAFKKGNEEESIRKRKRNVDKQIADLKNVQFFSRDSNRPPNVLSSWKFIQWVYRKTYYGPVEQSLFLLIGDLYFSESAMKDIAKRQRDFDEQRWKYTQHLMTVDDSLICRKRLAMTEEEMIDVLLQLQIKMVTMPQESRLGLMKEIFQNLPNCCQVLQSCKDMFEIRFLSNLRPELEATLDSPYHSPCRRCCNIISTYITTCNLLV